MMDASCFMAGKAAPPLCMISKERYSPTPTLCIIFTYDRKNADSSDTDSCLLLIRSRSDTTGAKYAIQGSVYSTPHTTSKNMIPRVPHMTQGGMQVIQRLVYVMALCSVSYAIPARSAMLSSIL